MKIKILTKSFKDLDKVEYYSKHLLLINPFLTTEISPKEREVLAVFMSFEGELAQVDRLGTSFRKQVKEILGMSAGGLTNHITTLKEKGYIYDKLEGTLAIQDYLFPNDTAQGYQIVITKKQ